MQKKNLATFELIRKLQDEFGFNRNMIGIAGLKDKQGVTSQWISLPKRDVQKLCGGINNLLAYLRKICKVITATYGSKLLKLGDNAGNKFEIILRPTRGEIRKQKELIESVMQQIDKEGVPNYFG